MTTLPVGRSPLVPVAVAAFSALCVLTSCQQKDYATARLEERDANIRQVCDMAERREAQGAERLRTDFRWIGEELQGDADATAANATKLRDRLDDETERWEARQAIYRDAAGRIFGGKPERIERTAISMFY